ncbi:hypothetical protein NIB78_12765 [Burkholderia multivorans]|uniref:hypothetical protein n=1 Tax=Burkholderia multivorans TaxID=87883 RepID=UPI001C24384B|nr:hypothetical protein [Burkholderia multivorans]MBU9245247.1 hypothetical protein [Burkholderia multivorans]MCO7336668.1 hypothetical protein [Burkholderia multivorans]MCO7338796.1 hypothetical protein [Burkholderia multivorans]MCO7346591.1 hypothetical protein [Burkholderia multivorans]
MRRIVACGAVRRLERNCSGEGAAMRRPSKGKQRQAKASKGKQRQAKASKGKQRQAKASKDKVEAMCLQCGRRDAAMLAVAMV